MCLNPIQRSYVNYLGRRKSVACACGHCLECAQKYQNDWSFRLSCESLYWKHVYFLTLTYDNENLPLRTISDSTYLSAANDALILLHKTKSRVKFLNNKKNEHIHNVLLGSQVGDLLPEVNKVDCQLYMKRLRESIRTEYNSYIKFFLCSEYGPNTFRPHYHILIYSNLAVGQISRFFTSCWDLGEVKFKEIQYDHSPEGDFQYISGYVSKYVSKPAVFESPWVNYGFVHKPFRLMSKGLGYRYVANIVNHYLNDWCKKFPSIFKSYQYDSDKCKFNIDFGNIAKSSILKLDISKYGEIVSALLHNFVYLRKTKSGKQHFFKFPRFFENFLFPLRKTQRFVYDESTKTFSYRTVNVLDSESALYRFYKDCLLAELDARSKAVAIAESCDKGITITQGYLLAVRQERSMVAERGKRLFESFSKFYYGKLSRPE
ncbi:replication initiator protein [Microvirus sp.]|nr:replication initiator protein [Microvirus sp.]